MKILFLEPQPCIRALKYAFGLTVWKGYELHFGHTGKTLTEFYGTGDELFKNWTKLEARVEDESIN